MTFTASDVLLKAASRIEEEGMWCQGHMFDLRGIDLHDYDKEQYIHVWLYEKGIRVPECAHGALVSTVVELIGRWDHLLYNEAVDQLTRPWHLDSGEARDDAVWRFNDGAGRTAAEVAEAMRRAAL